MRLQWPVLSVWVLFATATSAAEQECPVPDPPGVPSATMPGLGVSYLREIIVHALAQAPWTVVHQDANSVAIRRPLGEDSQMRQEWEAFAGTSDSVTYFDERRWILEPELDGTILTVRGYLLVVGADGEERELELLAGDWMHVIQCHLEEIRTIAIESQIEPAEESGR